MTLRLLRAHASVRLSAFGTVVAMPLSRSWPALEQGGECCPFLIMSTYKSCYTRASEPITTSFLLFVFCFVTDAVWRSGGRIPARYSRVADACRLVVAFCQAVENRGETRAGAGASLRLDRGAGRACLHTAVRGARGTRLGAVQAEGRAIGLRVVRHARRAVLWHGAGDIRAARMERLAQGARVTLCDARGTSRLARLAAR